MNKLILFLFFILPLVSFGQLGKTPNEIEGTLGKNYLVENVEGFLTYSYDYQFEYNGKKVIERYTFRFKKINDVFRFVTWTIIRPNEIQDQSYWYLEDFFKRNDAIYIGDIDRNTMNINLYRLEGYYFINVTYKDEYKID
jgi:hypothetical protein